MFCTNYLNTWPCISSRCQKHFHLDYDASNTFSQAFSLTGEYVVRLYILRALNLVACDADGRVDAYLDISLGSQHVHTRERHLSNVVDAEFYETFEFEANLPGDSILRIEVKDFDALDIPIPGLPKIPFIKPEGIPKRNFEIPMPPVRCSHPYHVSAPT